MSRSVQRRRGTTAEHATFTGALAELTVDTTKDTVVVHDGAVAGGYPLLRQDLSNLPAGTIDNADISASAEIAVSKLANGTARQLLQTDAAGTGVEFASNIDVPGTLDVTSAATFDNNVIIQGDLTVNGTETIINTQTLEVEDKNIIVGKVVTPSDVTADGGGITLKGTTDKTINWIDATDAWTLSEHVNIASAKEYRIDGTKALDATSLGSGVTSSSLTSVGTIGTGTWQGTAIDKTYLDATLVSTGDTGSVTSTMILDGTIVNADINASAAIVDTKLATIATAGKVSNSATTATNANTASAIVARDGSGNFTAGTITAAVTGAASSNVLKAGDTMTGALVVPLASAATPSLTFTGDLNTGIYSPGADQVAVATNGTERLRITSAGLVGIGTSSALTALHVQSAPGTDQIRWTDNTNGSGLLDTAAGASRMYSNVALAFGTGSATFSEKARIDSSGRLLVGTSTDGGAGGLTIRPNFSAGAALLVFDRANTASTSTVISFENNDGTVGTITHTNTATAYNTSSDYRLKENVVDLDGAIARLNQLPVHRFNFKADPDTVVDGFIAHEAQEVVPECVTGTKDEVDDDGNPVMQGIDQSKLVPLLTAALQEAIAKIEVLEQRLNDAGIN
jgi:hypothetical protein